MNEASQSISVEFRWSLESISWDYQGYLHEYPPSYGGARCQVAGRPYFHAMQVSSVPYFYALFYEGAETNNYGTYSLMTVNKDRIQKFNTKDTYPHQDLDNDLCQVVKTKNTIYLLGQVETTFAEDWVGLGDPVAQAEQTMKNVKQLLRGRKPTTGHLQNHHLHL